MKFQCLNSDEVIKKTIIFGEENASKPSPLHIAYGIDKNFLLGCGVSICSILTHNKYNDFVFHVFIDSIPNEEIQRFSQLALMYNTCINIHIINCDRLKKLPTTKNWSYAMYFRFLIADYFVNRQDRILYLDADVVCKGDISKLSDIDFEDNVAAVVTERDKIWWALRAKSLQCIELENGYFNSGVLLLNIVKWAKEFVSDKAKAMLSDDIVISKLTYMDQDVLNLILWDKVKFINNNYNTQFSINYELKDVVSNPINDDTIFIHYVGPTKPWHSWANYPSALYFTNAKNLSPWKDTPLMSPNNSNYARYCAKHKFKQKKILAGIINYINYLYFKVLK